MLFSPLKEMPGQGSGQAVVVRAASEPLLLRQPLVQEAGLRRDGEEQRPGKRQGTGECGLQVVHSLVSATSYARRFCRDSNSRDRGKHGYQTICLSSQTLLGANRVQIVPQRADAPYGNSSRGLPAAAQSSDECPCCCTGFLHVRGSVSSLLRVLLQKSAENITV